MVRRGQHWTASTLLLRVTRGVFALGWRQMGSRPSVQVPPPTHVGRFVVPYNLPPALCMKDGYMFLALVVHDPDHPGKHLNMFMRLLIEELKELWRGVEAYDRYNKVNFNLRVAYLWSVHDLLAWHMVWLVCSWPALLPGMYG